MQHGDAAPRRDSRQADRERGLTPYGPAPLTGLADLAPKFPGRSRGFRGRSTPISARRDGPRSGGALPRAPNPWLRTPPMTCGRIPVARNRRSRAKDVDLPTPLGPVTSAISPEPSRKDTPPNTMRSPRATDRSSIRRWHRCVISIFISGCPLSRSDRFRTPGWRAYRNEQFWISVFERKAAPLGRTAQEDEEVQFFGAAH